jgi:hypothetical protein
MSVAEKHRSNCRDEGKRKGNSRGFGSRAATTILAKGPIAEMEVVFGLENDPNVNDISHIQKLSGLE